MESSQAYCKDFLKRNPKKFILYFSKVPTNFYLISKFGSISVNWIIQKILEKKNRAVGPAFGPHPTAPLGQQPVMAAREPDVWACRRRHRCAVTVAAAGAGARAAPAHRWARCGSVCGMSTTGVESTRRATRGSGRLTVTVARYEDGGGGPTRRRSEAVAVLRGMACGSDVPYVSRKNRG
jgi:hypothetical protein